MQLDFVVGRWMDALVSLVTPVCIPARILSPFHTSLRRPFSSRAAS